MEPDGAAQRESAGFPVGVGLGVPALGGGGLLCPPPGEPLSYLKKFNKYFIFLYPLYIQISLIMPEILL